MTISSSTVTVAISLGTRSPAAAGFGVPAIFCLAPFSGSRLYEVSNEGLAAMVADGFSDTSGQYYRGYQMVQAMAAQSPHASQVRVFARSSISQQVLRLVPLKTDGEVVTISVQVGNTIVDLSRTVPASSSTAAEVAAWTALFGAVSGVNAADDTTHVTLTPTVATEFVQLRHHSVFDFTVQDLSLDAGIASDLTAAAAEPNAPFYRFAIDSTSETENNAAAVWAETATQIFYPQSPATENVLDAAGTGIGQDLFAAGYNNTGLWHSQDMVGNLGVAAMSRAAAFTPGTSAAHYKQPSGIVADAFTATHIANADGKNINLYAYNGDTPHTWHGVAASGRSLRIQSAIHFMEVRTKEAVLAVFLSNEFVPMSNSGFAMMENAVRGVLNAMARNGVIEPLNENSVTVPDISELSAAQLTDGVLPDLKFAVVMSDDMQKVEVSGTVALA